MRVGIKSQHWNDANGNPEGGTTFGNGFAIGWQHGPLGRHTPGCVTQEMINHDGGPGASHIYCSPDCMRREPNGAFVEDVIAAAEDRLEYYQKSRFACQENHEALMHLKSALDALNRRTRSRELRAVEGTHGQ